MAELYRLNAATIAELDRGALGIAIGKAIDKASADCVDRAADDRARKVEISIELVPRSDVDQDTRSIDIVGVVGKYRVRTKLPDYESKPLDFGVQSDGSLIFNAAIPDNHRARSLPFPEDDAEDQAVAESDDAAGE